MRRSAYKRDSAFDPDVEDVPEPRSPLRSVVDCLPLDKTLTRALRSGSPNALLNNRSIHSRHLPPSSFFLDLEKAVQSALRTMLNARELARVLNANVHPQLFSSWLVMSPNATLLAYSGSPNIQQLRDQAALLSQIWREQKDKLRGQSSTSLTEQFSSSASTTSTIAEGALETLTIENAKSNIIIRAVQPRLLLVLIGGSPPRRTSDFFKITAEARGDSRYPPESASSDAGSSGSAHDSARGDSPSSELLTQAHEESVIDTSMPPEYRDLSEKEKEEMLDLQRKKMDAATKFMRGDFETKKFVMPDEVSIP